DMRELYFNSGRDGGRERHDIWRATRASVDEPFDPPEALPDFNSEGRATSPAIALDGQTLWFAWTREPADDEDEAATDIYFVTRRSSGADFSSPRMAEGPINTAAQERPRPLGHDGKTMPFSRRDEEDGALWQTLLATQRADESFEDPILLEHLNEQQVGIVDAFLSQDGMTLIFKRQPAEGKGDLYWSQRRSLDEPFRNAVQVPGPEINLEDHEERDPWLSPDEQELYFVSDRDDSLSI